jgi:hypothetical protein
MPEPAPNRPAPLPNCNQGNQSRPPEKLALTAEQNAYLQNISQTATLFRWVFVWIPLIIGAVAVLARIVGHR